MMFIADLLLLIVPVYGLIKNGLALGLVFLIIQIFENKIVIVRARIL